MKRTVDLPCQPPPVVGFADRYSSGFVDEFHTHDRAQLSLFLAGSVTVSTKSESFVLRPGQALWLPANTLHQASCRTDMSFQVIYVDPDLSDADLPCRVFEGTTLLRGLIEEIIAMQYDFVMDERMLAIAQLLLHEIKYAPQITGRLLFPSDHRLLRVCEAIAAAPSDRHDITHWAREAGMARRSFTRLFQIEMGMGFSAWRRRLRALEAASRIESGQSIAQVAFDLGYDSAASFSSMFHKTFGTPPSRLRSIRSPIPQF